MSYHPPRERDAWFTVRGFVYQVQLTIERWLDLEPTACLELERGEDIDIVANWTLGGESSVRLLEQVKHRDAAITLNSPEARSALANFIDHRNHNPGMQLAFRYVTTATAGRETTPAMARGVKGIEVWEELRSGAHGGVGCLTNLAGLRGLLRKASRPDDIPAPTWRAYQDFLRGARAAELVGLVASFEWSTAQPSQRDLQRVLESRLLAEKLAQDSRHASQLYNQLFVHVFNALSAKATKRLTTAERDVALTATPPDDESVRILARITEALSALQRQIDSVVVRVDDHDATIVALRGQIAALSNADGMTGTVTALGPAPNLLPPLPPLARASRRDAVDAVLVALRSHAWVAIHGTSGAGKSELVLQVAESFAQRAHWIALRDYDSHAAGALLIAGLSAIANAPPTADRSRWYDVICSNLGGGILVVDDLPQLPPNGALGRELTHLALALRTHGVGLVTTSPHTLPRRLASALGSNVACLAAPEFTDEETQSLLRAFGATDDSISKPWAKFINAVTGGHAELVVTAAAFLKQRAWRFSEQELRDLLGRNYASGIQTDVMRRVTSTVPDKSARELLFRVSLFVGPFNREDLLAVATSKPPIQRPIEALSCLEGLWIQLHGGERFAACPLVKGLDSELDNDTRQSVHDTLGMRIMRRDTVGPLDVMAAIAHFLNAQQFERAGVAYVLALSSLERTELPAYDAGLFELWGKDPLPAQISLAVRIYIRSLQVAVHGRLGRELSFLTADLLALAESVSDNQVSSLLPLVPRVAELAKFDFARTNAQMVRVLRAQDKLVTPDGKRFEFPSHVRLDSFLWHQPSFARSERDVRVWLQSISTLDELVLREAATGIGYEMGCLGLCDRIWTSEAEKEESQRDWASATALLTEVESTAAALGLPLLAAAAQRAQMIVLAEYKVDLASAEAIAFTAMSAAPNDPRIAFLLLECLGREYVSAKREEDAVRALKSALALDSSSYELTRLYAQLSLSLALSGTAPIEAMHAADDAVALARVGRGFPQAELVKALSEAAIASFRAHGPASAFTRLDEAASLLFESRTDSSSWRDLVVLFAHTVGYLKALAVTGQPPPGQLVNGEDFAEPAPGIFLKHHRERHRLFTAEHECLIYACLAMFADAVGCDERLSYWQSKGRAEAIAVGSRHIFNYFNLLKITQSVADGDQVAAIQCAAEGQDSEVGILQALMGLSVSIADISLDDATLARRNACAAAELMVSLAPASAEGKLWKVAAHLLEIGFDPATPMDVLMALANEPTVNEMVQSAARLIASVREDAPPVIAVGVHISLSMTLLAQKQVFMQVHRRLLLPFLGHYWNRFAARSAFLLRAPVLTRAAILEAGTAPVEIRAQRILREVVSGLGAKCSPPVTQWLNGPTSSTARR